MNRSAITLILLASTLLLGTACKKVGKTFDVYFYSNIENSVGPLFLYIDGKKKGELPFLKTTMSPTNDTILDNALHLHLRTGKYKLEAKDSQGNQRNSGYIKFTSNSIGSGGTMGGRETSFSGNVIVTRIF